NYRKRSLSYPVVITVLFVACGVASPLRAQTDVEHPPDELLFAPAIDFSRQVIPQPAGPPPTPRHTGIKAMLKGLVIDLKYLPSRENLFWAGVGGGLALAVHPLDDDVNRKLVGNSTAENL